MSQIFSTLKVRLKSGRKAFSIRGANALAKVCILADKLSILGYRNTYSNRY